MRRLIMFICMIAAASASFGWPNLDEFVKARPVVKELLAAYEQELPAKAAEGVIALVDDAETEAARFLLLRRAVELYAKAGDDEKTAETFKKLLEIVEDVPATVQERILLEVGRVLSKASMRPVRTEAIYRGVRALVWAEKELKTAEKTLKQKGKSPSENAAAHLKAGNALAVIGDWPKALEHFQGTDGKLVPVANHEASGIAPADKLATAWWKAIDIAENEYVKSAYRLHSVEFYRKALKNNLLTGLNVNLAKNRIAEAEKEQDAVSHLRSLSNDNATRYLYCVIDLSEGANAKRYPFSYMPNPPESGFNVDEYKTTKLVLRRIEPGSFILGQNQKDESHRVTLTKPFYCGIFEVTQKQYELVKGYNPSKFKGDKRPVESVRYNMLRGNIEGTKWPGAPGVDADSFIGKIRARTKLNFDLLTEAQWEYACRAGTTSPFNNGGYSMADLKKVGRILWNCHDGKGGYSEHTTVGSYAPNAWGLYDMHGNVSEMCLDWLGELSYGKDPVGANSATHRALRNHPWWFASKGYYMSNDRMPAWGGKWLTGTGFRLAIHPAGLPIPSQRQGQAGGAK